jgi:Zn-dependent M28 family amino/carboxypeptidase
MKFESWVTEQVAQEIASMGNRKLDELVRAAQKREFSPVPLGVSVSVTIKSRIRTLNTANIAGVLTGSDPLKKNEYVIYTAHHDHLGIGKAIKGDSIYNGALDNASGVAMLMTIAHAFTELPVPPARSILFLSVAGEESGFLGSQYFVDHLPIPASTIAANLNVDGINIWGRTHDFCVIGYGKTSIDSTVKSIAAQQHRIVVPDQFPEKGSYYRSDQFSFAKIGVPAVSLSAGVEYIDKPAGWGKDVVEQWINEHYHQPSDEFSTAWDFTGAIEDTQLAFLTGFSLANQSSVPYWMPASEFAGRRK